MDNPNPGPSDSLTASQATGAIAALLDDDTPTGAPAVEDKPQPAAEQRTEAEGDQPTGEERQPGDDAGDTTTDEPEMFTVKIDGKEIQVPKSEVIAGYQRQQDATRKTMEAAEQRKQATAETEKARAERHQYAEQLQRFRHQLEGVLQEQQQIDWAKLIEENPHEAMRQQHLFNERQAALRQVAEQQGQLRQQAEAEQRAQFAEHLRDQREQVIAKIPEWKDEGKRKADVSAMQEYLKSHGYSADEIANVNDHRALVNVRKAMLYDKLMAEAKEATKKVANTPTKVERPGSADANVIDKRSAGFQRLSKSGTARDAASVIESLL